MGYLHPGIPEIQTVSEKIRRKGTIAAAGGSRREKNNGPLAQAVRAMGGRAVLEIYGGWGKESGPYLTDMGPVPHEVFLEKLRETEIFVVNSIFEPFSLAALEALQCGCSLLISEAAGAAELLELEEGDVIHDPMDPEEIRRKLDHLLAHPNNRRLLSSRESWSSGAAAARLEGLCAALVKGERP